MGIFFCAGIPATTFRQKKLAALRFRRKLRKLRLRSLLLPLKIKPASLGFDFVFFRGF
jgi:hypothetical protein